MKGNSVKLTNLFTASVLACAVTVSPIVMAADAPLSAAQKKDVEKVVHDYLVSNPEVLLEVSQVLQQKQQKVIEQKTVSAISGNANQLFDERLTVAGNPNGTVTLVEFFDNQCVHCKNIAPTINKLIKKNTNLRVVYKEFPIFGKGSDFASRAALAAAMQGKYVEMHDALIQQTKRLNDNIILDMAKSAGLDMTKLKTDMDSKAVTTALDANRKLAEKLHLMGTPAIIVASTPAGQLKSGTIPAFVPGAATEDTLQQLINKAAAS